MPTPGMGIRMPDEPEPTPDARVAHNAAAHPEIPRRRSAFIPWATAGAATVLLIVGVSLVRLAYVLWLCPYTLAEDEAHYWEWSRRPDLSYYTKGPAVAWGIAASTSLFRALGLPCDEGTVRLPAVVWAAGATAAVALLARDVARDNRAGFLAAALLLLTPVFQLGSLLVTVDMPCLALCTAGAWCAWHALHRRARWAWAGLGASIGAGFLVKYTALMLIAGVALYALACRRTLRVAPGWAVHAAGGLGLLATGMAPVMIWNMVRGWPTWQHLLGHLGMPGGDMPVTQTLEHWRYNPLWTGEYLLGQVLMALPASALALAAVAARRTREPRDADRRAGQWFLLLVPLPTLVLYLLVSLVTQVEANWTLPAYGPLVALGAWHVLWAHEAQREPEADGRGAQTGVLLWRGAVMIGLVSALVTARLDMFPRLPGVSRLLGAREQARHAAEILDALKRETRREPFVLAAHYGRASQLAFYLPGQPRVLYAGHALGGRRTAYDFWPDTRLDAADLRGRPALLVGGQREAWSPAFEIVRDLGPLRGEHKRGRSAFAGLNYRGFPPGVPAPTSPAVSSSPGAAEPAAGRHPERGP